MEQRNRKQSEWLQASLKTILWIAVALLLYYLALLVGQFLIALIFIIQDIVCGNICFDQLGALYNGVPIMESEAYIIRYSYESSGYATLLALPVVLLGFRLLHKKQNIFAPTIPSYYKHFPKTSSALAFLAGFCANVLVAFVVAHTFLKDVSNATNSTFDLIFLHTPFWLLILGTAIATPLMEEMTFRGFIYTKLQTAMEPWIGKRSHILTIVLQALLFGLIHMNLQQFVYAFALGLLFGLMRRDTNSVWPGIFAHVGFNFFSVCLYELTKYAEEWPFAAWFVEQYDTTLVWLALPTFALSLFFFGITVKMQQKNAGKTSQNQ